MAWVFLLCAILAEVCGTLSLRMATTSHRAWYAGVLGGYLLAFVFLTLTLRQGVGIGVAYGIWAALGIALAAVAGRLLFREPFTRIMALGMVCVIAGVLLVELGTPH